LTPIRRRKATKRRKSATGVASYNPFLGKLIGPAAGGRKLVARTAII
jgi:hypothetical protein